MVEYKGFNIGFEGRFPKVIIRSIGKGALPKMLNGGFKSKHSAQEAVDRYLSLKEKGGKSNAKKQSTSGNK